MQGVTAVIPGAGAVSPRALGLSSSASSSERGWGVTSSFFGGKAARLQDSTASRSKASTGDAGLKGTGSQVKVSASKKEPFNLLSLLEGIIMHPTKHDQSVEYKGIARIAKKRASVGTLLQSDLVDLVAAAEDKAVELLGQQIQIQLVSVDLDPETKSPKLSATSTVEGWVTNTGDFDLVADEDFYSINFTVPKDFGVPGAFVIKNNHPNEFFLKSLVLEDSDKTKIEFLALAWIHNHSRYPKDRVFFSTKTYLPSATPPGLQALRQQELEQSRGDGTGERNNWDRIYDYDVYNDLGNPDSDPALTRPNLGGNKDLPYPRRIRTGRPMSKTVPTAESNLEGLGKYPYLPSDEFFLRTKNSTFIAGFLKGLSHSILPAIGDALGRETNFSSIQDLRNLYKDGLPLRIPVSVFNNSATPELDAQRGDLVYLSTLFAAKGENTSLIVYPNPQVIAHDEKAWSTDEEFGRQALAGEHASVIELLKTYPPTSTLDPTEYGQATALTDQHILPYIEKFKTVKEAIEAKKLFIIDYHDAVLPFIARANADTAKGFLCYAPRTIFFLDGAGQLKPIAVELTLPPAQKGGKASIRVFTPANAPDYLWALAKIHSSAIDTNFHEVLSHFTYTHGVMEPFIIASNRQLSKLHPIRTLLQPHFKDTMAINAAARGSLINAAGIIEETFSMGQYAMQLGSKGYGALWRFDTQAAPQNLISRGMAEPADASHPGSVKLVVEDYPWAKDGLEVWDALNKWVASYVDIVYKGSDQAVKNDTELQAWWKEIINVGHGDLKDAPWWPKLDSIKNLVQIVTTIGWVAGPVHAALNFGQFAYGGFPLNKPTATRKLIPEVDSDEYKELQKNPEKFFLSSITTSSQATTVMTILELLATHSVDEEYFGSETIYANWSSDPQVADAFREFQDRVADLAVNIIARNKDTSLIHRSGPAKVPFTLFFPTSTTGLTGQGVPYSVSI